MPKSDLELSVRKDVIVLVGLDKNNNAVFAPGLFDLVRANKTEA